MKFYQILSRVVAVILLTSCTAMTEHQTQLTSEGTSQSPQKIVLDDNFQAVMGQTVYAPVYSEVYHGNGKKTFDLAATLSIRNTDFENTIVIKSVKYYNWNGKLVRNYLEQPIEISALSSTEFFVDYEDRTGGSGAKFIVEWIAQTNVTEPIIEVVMISTGNQQGISFMIPSKVIKNLNDS